MSKFGRSCRRWVPWPPPVLPCRLCRINSGRLSSCLLVKDTSWLTCHQCNGHLTATYGRPRLAWTVSVIWNSSWNDFGCELAGIRRMHHLTIAPQWLVSHFAFFPKSPFKNIISLLFQYVEPAPIKTDLFWDHFGDSIHYICRLSTSHCITGLGSLGVYNWDLSHIYLLSYFFCILGLHSSLEDSSGASCLSVFSLHAHSICVDILQIFWCPPAAPKILSEWVSANMCVCECVVCNKLASQSDCSLTSGLCFLRPALNLITDYKKQIHGCLDTSYLIYPSI